ncbi:MAG: hypothetical protein LBU42_05940 [Prevotellaceae bacterium]|jgi:uncharacterized protein (TIGR02145 family)|nr:hypothetical protein [Prevotellaceae bacterium]
MKNIFFLFAMLASVAASATIKVTPLSTDYSENKVTFKVEWTSTPTAPYNNRVWVWVDFCPVTGATPANSFSAATISNPAKTGGNGTVTNATARGFFIEYAATNNGTTVTATLNASGKFHWCAYGSDYPPNVLANTNSSYTLAGTPPFLLIASDGTTSLTVSGTTIAASALTFTPATITDATGYPGLWCPYTGSDLYMDATHRCLQRQSGAGNWEAWIKDNRDSKPYRIVKMPDNNWWLAQNVKYAGAGSAVGTSGCTEDLCGRYYSVNVFRNGGALNTKIQGLCPSGWFVPLWTDYDALATAIGSQECVRALNYPPLVTCAGEKNVWGMAATYDYVRATNTINGARDPYYWGTTNGTLSVWAFNGECNCKGRYTMITAGEPGVTWRCYR